MNEKTSPRISPWHLTLVTSILLSLVARPSVADFGRPDPPSNPNPPTWGVSSPTLMEGQKATKAMTFIFKSPRPGPLTYHCDTYDKSATAADGDYQPVHDVRTLAADQTVDSVVVFVNGDTRHEKDETFLFAITGQGLDLDVAVGTIVNDDLFPSFSTSNVSTLEGNGGPTMVDVPLHFDRPSSMPITLGYQTIDGNASVGDFDYAGASGTVVVPAGQLDATVSIAIQGDGRREPSEGFLVRFFDPLFPGHGQAQGVVTILTDDLAGPPAVTLTRPNGGESFLAGEQERIAWTSSPDVTVDVLLSRDGGASWSTLGQGQYDAGYAHWVADGNATDFALVKVVVHDPLGGSAEDVSNAPFTIKQGQNSPGDLTPVLVQTGARVIDAGVELRWRLAPGVEARSVVIERREGSASVWRELDLPLQNDGEMTVAIDPDVLPGHTYAYRLVVDVGTGEPERVLLSEVTVGATRSGAALAVMPNPSRGSLWIRFVAARRGPVRVTVHDVQGREVAVAAARSFVAGEHAVRWDAPRGLPHGLYFVRCAADGAVHTRRVALVE